MGFEDSGWDCCFEMGDSAGIAVAGMGLLLRDGGFHQLLMREAFWWSNLGLVLQQHLMKGAFRWCDFEVAFQQLLKKGAFRWNDLKLSLRQIFLFKFFGGTDLLECTARNF